MELRGKLSDAAAEVEALKTAIDCLNEEVRGYSRREKELREKIKIADDDKFALERAHMAQIERLEKDLSSTKKKMRKEREAHEEHFGRYKLKFAQEQYMAKKLVG